MATQASRLTLTVEGMGCGVCAANVEGALKQARGVQSASVSFERGDAVVEYDPTQTARASLVSLVEERGYSVPRAA